MRTQMKLHTSGERRTSAADKSHGSIYEKVIFLPWGAIMLGFNFSFRRFFASQDGWRGLSCLSLLLERG